MRIRCGRCIQSIFGGAAISLVTLFAVCLSGVLPVHAQVADRIVAVVNGEIITLFDLNRRFEPVMRQIEGRTLSVADEDRLKAMKRQLLDRMVVDTLLMQEAERLGMRASDAEVEDQIKEMLQQNRMSEERFREELVQQGITRSQYVTELRREISINRLISTRVHNKIAVSDQEITEYFQANMKHLGSGRTVDLQLILLPPGEDAEALRQRIQRKEIDFAEAARQFSRGPGAQEGGGIGSFAFDQLAPAWRNALQNVSPGEISPPFDLSGGTALLKLVGEASGDAPGPGVAERIRETLAKPKYEEVYSNYIERLKSRAIIDIRM